MSKSDYDNSVYHKALNDVRSEESALSDYKVTKPWGWERWLDLNECYAMKVIHMTAGNVSSLQSHKQKIEANYVIEGKAMVFVEDEAKGPGLHARIIGVGEGWRVLPGIKHRVVAMTDYTAIEASSPELDDVIRHTDVYERSNGKIDNEHK